MQARQQTTLATAFFVMSIAEVSKFCAANPDVKALVLADPDKASGGRSTLDRNTPLLVQTFNFPETELQFFAQAS